MRKLIPWSGRICAKVILSRLPAGYALWRSLNHFRRGAIHRADYALRVFQRMYHLPANGVMRISDCGDPLGNVFEVGKEVEGYSTVEEILVKLRHYLQNDKARGEIARAERRRVLQEYRIATVNAKAAALIAEGMKCA